MVDVVSALLGALLGVLVAATLYFFQNKANPKSAEAKRSAQPTSASTSAPPPEQSTASGGCCGGGCCGGEKDAPPQRRILLLYATQKGTARTFAHKLYSNIMTWRSTTLEDKVAVPVIADAKDYDPDSLTKEDIILFICSTYTGGSAPERCAEFGSLLKEMATDFRYGAGFLGGQQFAVFGLGDIAYSANFARFGKDASDWFRSLGAKQIMPAVCATESKSQALFARFMGDVKIWLEKAVKPKKQKKPEDGCCGEGCCNDDGEPVESDSEEENASGDEDEAEEDIEDIAQPGIDQELLYPMLRKSLTKQGYSLIGSHSGVKICRWTKAMLRGRGGCYKHTFYNIASFQCMEMTPSLACANKCVFCWRHHSNPVATEFKWKMDSPEFLVENAIAAHQGMIKPLKGMEGVKPDRYIEAMNVRHCALSLVGEPIIYPAINEFIDILHKKHISTFMVTNAQFPEKVRDLRPVTQLYLSIDAATPESLKAIDRPLFEDFWERLLASIKELSMKKQRTVFRLTLVTGWNMEGLKDYISLIRMGMPDLIEVKGVTFCGDSGASGIRMSNVPYHEDVIEYCQAMERLLDGEYLISCEHAHSCCVLLARKKYLVNGAWHTWIDYGKFFELIERGETEFDAMAYAAPTPTWAIYQSKEKGFDPAEVKHERKGKKGAPVIGGC